jgi:hypothetical protein
MTSKRYRCHDSQKVVERYKFRSYLEEPLREPVYPWRRTGNQSKCYLCELLARYLAGYAKKGKTDGKNYQKLKKAYALNNCFEVGPSSETRWKLKNRLPRG